MRLQWCVNNIWVIYLEVACSNHAADLFFFIGDYGRQLTLSRWLCARLWLPSNDILWKQLTYHDCAPKDEGIWKAHRALHMWMMTENVNERIATYEDNLDDWGSVWLVGIGLHEKCDQSVNINNRTQKRLVRRHDRGLSRKSSPTRNSKFGESFFQLSRLSDWWFEHRSCLGVYSV